MIMLKSTHDRAMAVKDAECQEIIAKLRAELRTVCAACEDRVNDLMTENARLTRALGVIDRNNEKLFLANADLIQQNEALKRELRPFRTPRPRAKNGWYLSDAQAAALARQEQAA